MAAISDGDLLRKIFNHSSSTPITNRMVSDALSPRPYEKRRQIIDRLLADDVVGWVHTHAGRITAVEDFAGVRQFPEFGDAFISKTNEVTTDRTQRANTNNGSMSYLFLRNPAVGMSLADVEAAVHTALTLARQQRAADRREHANSPVGKAERALSQALRTEDGMVSIRPYETTDGRVTYSINLSLLNYGQVDHLTRVLREHPYGA